ncbi:hypothetical protein ACEZCY_14515 [Streptacidiphilus sp. N1-12]|uniref:Uncharacterized protein n=2 Tax=Streptacidiphilus alkalitolerans TaxID=3342712 RepID=A0ABV6V9S2_9ACTN
MTTPPPRGATAARAALRDRLAARLRHDLKTRTEPVPGPAGGMGLTEYDLADTVLDDLKAELAELDQLRATVSTEQMPPRPNRSGGNARRLVYLALMAGGDHSPDRSERATDLIEELLADEGAALRAHYDRAASALSELLLVAECWDVECPRTLGTPSVVHIIRRIVGTALGLPPALLKSRASQPAPVLDREDLARRCRAEELAFRTAARPPLTGIVNLGSIS